MAAPVAEEDSLAGEHSDPDPDLSPNYSKSPISVEDYIAIAQLTKASNTQRNDPDDPSSDKRRKSKPIRFAVSPSDMKKKHPSPKIKIVVSKTSTPSSSLKKAKSQTKSLKTSASTSPAMIKAGEFQATLGTEFPTCIKLMVRSQVTYGFWMGLPLPFCRSFLPKEDITFVLEDVHGRQWKVKYLAQKNGLSAGWKNFVVAHGLIEGDVLVFQLIDTSRLKIYVFKSSESKEVDGALSLLNLDARKEDMTPVTPSPKPKKRKHLEPLPINMVKTTPKKSTKKSTPPSKSITNAIEVLEHSGTNSEDIMSEVLEPSAHDHLKSFDHFRIIVKGQCLDSELPEEVKLCYYKLCTYKNQILHEGIREGLYYKLVAGMIGETVNIAKEIKNCKLTISKEDLEAWDNSLKSFEILGMRVDFLRDKIRSILGLVFGSEFGVDVKKYVDAKKEEKIIEDEIVKVKGRLSELKRKARDFEGVLGSLKDKTEKYMIEFRNEVDLPW